jgi:hypothetical protein
LTTDSFPFRLSYEGATCICELHRRHWRRLWFFRPPHAPTVGPGVVALLAMRCMTDNITVEEGAASRVAQPQLCPNTERCFIKRR